ncbi:MAG: hypothetical protein A2X08_11485, partial [Bacteroidetes bacterium GWA2_32_17]
VLSESVESKTAKIDTMQSKQTKSSSVVSDSLTSAKATIDSIKAQTIIADTIKTAQLNTDSIQVEKAKAEAVSIGGAVNLANEKLAVVGNTGIYGEFNVTGNIKTAGSLTFAGDKVISYQPTTGGFGNYCFGTGPPPPPADPCFFPNTNNLIVQGTFYSWGHRNWDSQQPITVMQMGFDGANGIIDLAGTNSDGGPGLLINYYCGKKVYINTGEHGGDIQLTGGLGKVGIGITPESAGPKLDINGDIKIRTLNTPLNNYNVLVADDNGLVGKKTITEIGDGLGNHTATQNIILGDKWLTASTTENNGLHLSPNGNLTMIIGGNNSFEIKGGNEIPWRRGIGIPDEAVSGQFNFYLNSWQTDAAFNFNSHTPAYNTTPEDPSTEVPAVTTNLFTILKNGKVGIGTDDPHEKLDIDGNLRVRNGDIYLKLSGSIYHGLGWYGTASENYGKGLFAGKDINGPVLYGYNGGALGSRQSGTETIALQWFPNGNIGISELNPTAKLHITASGSDGLIVSTTGTNDCFKGVVNDTGTKAISIYNGSNLNFLVKGNGKVWAREVNVLLTAPLGDFVFAPDYMLMTIYELENYIKQEHHFPKMPSAKEVKEKGMNVGEFQNLLLQQTEEQALYIISMQKQIDYLKKEIKEFSLYIIQLEKRINELEKK